MDALQVAVAPAKVAGPGALGQQLRREREAAPRGEAGTGPSPGASCVSSPASSLSTASAPAVPSAATAALGAAGLRGEVGRLREGTLRA